MHCRNLLVTIMTLFFALSSASYGFAAVFLDVENHWAENEITDWAQKGLIKGYNDNTFKPNQQLTRAEFVAITNRAFNIGSGTVVSDFKDVPSNVWYYHDISTAKSNGYMSGYADDTFRPNQAITRQEAASALAKLLKLEPDNSADNFKDANEFPGWARGSINAVVSNGLMLGTPDNKFNPSNNITRAEAVVSLDRSLQLINTQQQVNSNIEGTITFRDQELKDVTIRVLNADDYKLIKEELVTNGHFKLELEPGNYDISATTDAEIAYLSDITVTENQTTTVEVVLEETAFVCGTLEDKYGNVVKDAVLTFTTNPIFMTTTDDSGKLYLSVLPNKTYEVAVFLPGNETGQPDAVYNDFVVGAAGQTYTLSLKTSSSNSARRSSHNNDNNDNDDSNDNDEDNNGDDDDNNDSKKLDLEIVKVEGNTKNGKGNMLTVVVGGNDLSKVMDQFKQARDEYFRDKEVPPEDSLKSEYYTVVNDLNNYIIDLYKIKIQDAEAYRLSFVDKDLDSILDSLNVQISKKENAEIDWQTAIESGQLSLSFIYNGQTIEIGQKEGAVDGGCSHESEEQGQEPAKDKAEPETTPPVGDSSDSPNIEIINIKGNINNDKGSKITIVIGGSKDSNGIGLFEDCIGSLKMNIKGVQIKKKDCTYEDLDFDLVADVLNAKISKDSIWDELEEDENGVKSITLRMTYNGEEIEKTVPITTGGGCSGDHEDGGGCGGEDHEDEEGGCGHDSGDGCGEDHEEEEGDCGGGSGSKGSCSDDSVTSENKTVNTIENNNNEADVTVTEETVEIDNITDIVETENTNNETEVEESSIIENESEPETTDDSDITEVEETDAI